MDCVKQIQKDKRTIVFGTSSCGFTQEALKLLPDAQVLFFDKQKAAGQQMKELLQERLNHKTVPMVFIDGDFVGGYGDLRNKLKDLK